MPSDLAFYLVAWPTLFAISFIKGGFGGGFAILGVPMLALVMPPLDAAIVMAPLVVLMDAFALGAYPPRTWSRENLVLLVPALLLGIGVGVLTFVYVDQRIVIALIGLVTVAFAVRYLAGGGMAAAPATPSLRRAALWGGLSGFTTFVAHSGGPPLAIYLLPLRLDKTVYAGTTVLFFAVGNLAKLGPYLWLGSFKPELAWTLLAIAPSVPLGVWAGRALHARVTDRALYRVCHLLLLAAGAKLLADGISALAT